MFCMAKQSRHRALLADVAYRQATSFASQAVLLASQTWSAVPRPTLVFGVARCDTLQIIRVLQKV